jgi:hypothetical protein
MECPFFAPDAEKSGISTPKPRSTPNAVAWPLRRGVQMMCEHMSWVK